MEIRHLTLGMVNVYLVKTGSGCFLIDSQIAFSRSKLEQAKHRKALYPLISGWLLPLMAISTISATALNSKKNIIKDCSA